MPALCEKNECDGHWGLIRQKFRPDLKRYSRVIRCLPPVMPIEAVEPSLYGSVVSSYSAARHQRTIGHPGIEQPTLLQVVNEKRQLAEWRDRARGVPFHLHPAAKRVCGSENFLNLGFFTRRARTSSIVHPSVPAKSADLCLAPKPNFRRLLREIRERRRAA